MQAQTQDPSRIIARALTEARGRGLDRLGQTRWAAARVLAVRPDLDPAEITRTVERAADQLPV